ncbi:YheT family hydrolase [Halobacteriovorax sp.]|uniref:YheT family hydrolase n=1 Tax=Halobacteriovorax sp. TaxID=2020862 RepID=UPI00356B0946
MPLISSSTHKSENILRNGHIQTLYPYFFRKIRGVTYSRERILTEDNDFIDIDKSKVGSKKAAILSHGLEGSSDTQYIRGMTKHLNSVGIDVISWNMRSCSGELNWTEKFYHAATITDLDLVIEDTLNNNSYDEVFLLGFSLGAALTTNYLGLKSENVNSRIKRSVVLSAPCDLKSSIAELSRPMNKMYLENFLGTMRNKILEKHSTIGLSKVDIRDLKKVKTFQDFDNRFTAPLHGFEDANDYYEKASCKNKIQNIKIPTLMINAKNDPFLGDDCYPVHEAKQNNKFFLEIPPSGGHIGFMENFKKGTLWSELRAQQFLLEDNF